MALRLRYLAALALLPLIPSCTVALAKSHAEKPNLFAGTPREQVIAKLGKPVKSSSYPKPLRIRDLPERAGKPKMHQGPAYKIAAHKDEFLVRGWYGGGWTKMDSLSVSSASTGFLLEPLTSTAALAERSRLASQQHKVRAWYGPDYRLVYSEWD
ncbi:hypothetical protein [Haloferula sp. BvORR071]|uniref:hypothetical protein n=1 Tax=Haloferula sp. BvORR071 TaxID=1396141 RepID=UPI000552E98D|nr:hypothetical protein [Haloferula sp. BvORR071]